MQSKVGSEAKPVRFIYGGGDHLSPETSSSRTFGWLRPVALLAVSDHIFTVSQVTRLSKPLKTPRHLKKSTPFDQVASGISDLFCECSKKSLNDPDLLVSRVLRTFYVAGFACIYLFCQPCVERSGLSITDHGQPHFFCRTCMDSVQFSFAPGTGMETLQKPQRTEVFGSGN